MKLFESMAAGCATVAANLGQIPEIVAHGETGLLYRAGSASDLAQQVSALLENRELAERMGRAARKIVMEKYTWSAVAAKVARIADELIERLGEAVWPEK